MAPLPIPLPLGFGGKFQIFHHPNLNKSRSRIYLKLIWKKTHIQKNFLLKFSNEPNKTLLFYRDEKKRIFAN